MKTLLFITAFTLAGFANALAETNETQEIAAVSGMLMQDENTTAIISQNFGSASITYNGAELKGLTSGNSIVCFGRIINPTELPGAAISVIQKKFKHCELQKAAIIITPDGNINYYACIKNETNYTLVKISPECKILYIKKQINKQNITTTPS